MFDKILIANRGEIACRVIRTARRMGIRTVAVYSEADADALHVRQADEAVLIGPPPSARSYLNVERIVEAIRKTGAQAVHPGYGFLSENAAFARVLEDMGVVFIGPPPSAIAAMGDKIESKRAAQAAGVSTVPGHMGIIEDVDEALRIAEGIGFPVMIKASAGGGGKGMRVAEGPGDLAEGFRLARNEAVSSFGDGRVFIEKFIEEPRHIEIQVLADAHGNCVHLGERECSIQRRHQKVIEEAPSPLLDPETRRAMGAQAVALAKAVGYRSAGTVEFIADQQKRFYFLEMNTRLQVEHPVTELVTGLDLVELMIRVAAGEPLPFAQDDVRLTGWALEARVYAEDPYRRFVPSIGRLKRYRPPAEGNGVRVDTGVYEGGEISMHYDPMIAKLVTHGDTRREAIERMRDALDAYVIRGVGHNIPFLAALVRHPRFESGRLSTSFIADEYPSGFAGAAPGPEEDAVIVATAVLAHLRTRAREARLSGQMPGYRPKVDPEWVVAWGERSHRVHASSTAEGCDVLLQGGRLLSLRSDWQPGMALARVLLGEDELFVQIARRPEGFRVTYAGVTADVAVRTRRAADLAAHMKAKVAVDMSRFVMSPMPGLVLSLSVKEDDEVKLGQEVAVIEAMKMENVLRAERDGRVVRIRVKPGDSVAADQILVEFG